MNDKCPIANLDKILLATDGSEYSAGAVREAINLSSRCSAKLTAIDVVEANQEFLAYAPDLVEKQEAEAEKHLVAVKEQATKAGVDCEIATHIGDPLYSVIIDVLQKCGAELVVMGRRGLSGIAKVAMGSVTARVIGHSPADVLVVPRAAKLENKAVMAATDGSVYGGAAVREGIRFARRCGCPLLVLSVASSESAAAEAEDALEKAKKIAAEEDFAIETLVGYGRAHEQIVATAKARGIDLIVVSSHGRNALETLLMGSVTERVVAHAACAVLVARAF